MGTSSRTGIDYRVRLLCAFLVSCIFGKVSYSQSTPLPGPELAGYQYAERCVGSDIGSQIMDCAARLPTASNGNKAGTIILPNTAENPKEGNWSTAVKLGPGVNLTGQGLFASSFHCTVAGPCLTHDASAQDRANAHTVFPNTVWQGFTITGDASPGQEILHFSDAQGVTLRDIAVDGANEPGGACIHLEDASWWTERNDFINVSTLYGCKIGWRFTALPTDRYQPYPSFGYNRFLDIKVNTNGPQIAFSFEGNSYLYDSTFRVTINKGAGSVLFHMQDRAEYSINETYISGEENGQGGYRFELGPQNIFTYYGEISLSVDSDKLAPGSIFVHFGDDSGYGPSIPTYFSNSVQWQRAGELADGADLDRETSCGTFAGRRLGHAPEAIGANSLRVEVVCSRDRNYLTQIGFQMDYPGANLRPRVWQRIRANGLWGAWREMGWADQLPLAGSTGELPLRPIPPQACDTLSAVVAGAAPGMVVAATPAKPAAVNPGLHWDTAYVSAANTVAVPVCNATSGAITPNHSLTFNVRVIP